MLLALFPNFLFWIFLPIPENHSFPYGNICKIIQVYLCFLQSMTTTRYQRLVPLPQGRTTLGVNCTSELPVDSGCGKTLAEPASLLSFFPELSHPSYSITSFTQRSPSLNYLHKSFCLRLSSQGTQSKTGPVYESIVLGGRGEGQKKYQFKKSPEYKPLGTEGSLHLIGFQMGHALCL